MAPEYFRSPEFLKWLCDTRAVIQFSNMASNLEAYPEVSMKARLVDLEVDGDLFIVTVDYSEFDDHNKGCERPNYFDDDGEARLTPREAGWYNPVEKLYVGHDWANYFRMIESGEDMSLLGRAYKALATKDEAWDAFVQRLAVEYAKEKGF